MKIKKVEIEDSYKKDKSTFSTSVTGLLLQAIDNIFGKSKKKNIFQTSRNKGMLTAVVILTYHFVGEEDFLNIVNSLTDDDKLMFYNILSHMADNGIGELKKLMMDKDPMALGLRTIGTNTKDEESNKTNNCGIDAMFDNIEHVGNFPVPTDKEGKPVLHSII